MEDNREELRSQEPQEEQEAGYVQRPKWQVWGARAALVIFLMFVALQLWQIAGGGL